MTLVVWTTKEIFSQGEDDGKDEVVMMACVLLSNDETCV